MIRSLTEIEKEICEARERTESLVAERDAALRRKKIECSGCKRKTTVSLLTYIQTHFYVHPYSCTGGDYWKQGEGQWVCPKCGHTNRPINSKVDFTPLKRYFKEVVDKHGSKY